MSNLYVTLGNDNYHKNERVRGGGLEVFFNVKSALKLVNKFKSNHT